MQISVCLQIKLSAEIMKKLLIYTVLSLATASFSSCSDSEQKKTHTQNEGKGGKIYGGIINISEAEKVENIAPYSLTILSSSHVSSQIFEGLVKLNPKDLSIQPLLAEKWEVDENETKYTFYLKKGVLFHNDPCFKEGKGREFNAQDVKYTFQKICTSFPTNYSFNSTIKDIVVGANDFFAASNSEKPITDLEGVKIIDDYTVEIYLTKPSPLFLYTLASINMSIVSEEADEMYADKNVIGTGPFVYQKPSDESSLTLIKNKDYHGVDELGNKLPFIDTLEVFFIESKKMELDWFENDKLDLVVGLPSESIKDMVEKQISNFENKPPKYVLSRNPEMATQYYEFNINRPHFKNIKVRQAFNYAIDRDKIINEILKGEAYGPGVHGLTPPTFKGYDITKITGYNYDPEKAKKLMAEAGFPNGKGFPTIKLELNSGGSKNVNVAFEIQKQLQSTLGIKIDLEVVSLQQKVEDAKYARADMFRSAWIADYPSPENFLVLLYGKNVPGSLDQPSFPNVTRYVNPQYDELFEKGKQLSNEEERYEFFYKAEQLAINDAPVMVIWYDEKYTLQKSHLQNFYSNPMNLRYFADVYLKAPTPAEKSAKK